MNKFPRYAVIANNVIFAVFAFRADANAFAQETSPRAYVKKLTLDEIFELLS